jgi:hypothetical protein
MLEKSRWGDWAETSIMVRSRPYGKSGYSVARNGYDFGDGTIIASEAAPPQGVISAPARIVPATVRSGNGGFVSQRAPRELLVVADPPGGFVPSNRALMPAVATRTVNTTAELPRSSSDVLALELMQHRPPMRSDTETTSVTRTGEEMRHERMAADAMNGHRRPGDAVSPLEMRARYARRFQGLQDPSGDGGARGGSGSYVGALAILGVWAGLMIWIGSRRAEEMEMSR